MNDVETYQYRGCKIRVCHDDDPSSPREDDNMGTMACWHRRYNLGDEQPKESPDDYLLNLARQANPVFDALCDKWDSTGSESIGTKVRARQEKVLSRYYTILPLYLYDHSGITMRCTPFSCPWDSGRVGLIFISLEKVRKELGLTKGTWSTKHKFHDGSRETLRSYAERMLRAEVEVYDQFISGDVYGYVVETPTGEHIDSCWGFFGHDETKEDSYMVKDNAKPAIDAYVEKNPVPEVGSKVHVTDVGNGVVEEIDFKNEEYTVDVDDTGSQAFPMKDVVLFSIWLNQQHDNTEKLAYS